MCEDERAYILWQVTLEKLEYGNAGKRYLGQRSKNKVGLHCVMSWLEMRDNIAIMSAVRRPLLLKRIL